MPNLNIKALNVGDTQESIREKINSNFDSIVAAGGGPQGQQGQQGDQGPIGPAGPKGDPGQERTILSLNTPALAGLIQVKT